MIKSYLYGAHLKGARGYFQLFSVVVCTPNRSLVTRRGTLLVQAPFSRVVKVIVFVLFEDGFNVFLWCCSHTMLKDQRYCSQNGDVIGVCKLTPTDGLFRIFLECVHTR